MINTVKHLAYTLKVPVSELEMIAGVPDSYYYQKKQPKRHIHGTIRRDNKGNIVFRVLNPSIGRFKEIQKRINGYILQKMKVPEYAHGAMLGKDNVTNARRHLGKKYIFTTDLKKFFPSINHKAVFAMFRNHGFSPAVSRLLTKLTTHKGQLPQGAPASPMLANLVFADKCGELEALAKTLRLTFTTFVDDLTFSSSKDFKAHHNRIINCIQQAGFRICYPKTNYRTKNPMVTGIIVKNNSLDLPATFKSKMKDIEGKTRKQISALQQYANRVLSA